MELEVNGRLIKVTLSRRNLRTLLLKLDEPDSAKTLVRGGPTYTLVVQAEDDAEHYGERAPGPMHPREEARLNQ